MLDDIVTWSLVVSLGQLCRGGGLLLHRSRALLGVGLGTLRSIEDSYGRPLGECGDTVDSTIFPERDHSLPYH